MAAPAIATDLDGTLLRRDGTISARTRDVLAAAAERRMAVIFVTARPPRWVDHLDDIVGPHGVVLCLNGAFEYDVRERRILAEHTLAEQTVRELVADLRTALPDIVFGMERVDGIALERGYTSDYPIPPGARFGPAEDLLDVLPGKVLARCPGLPSEEFLAAVTAVLGDRAHVAFSGAVGLAEISAPGVTKAAALERWCAREGIPAEGVWAFGDMPNDLPMLGWAGTAVAVANAHPSVLAAADLVAASNDEDGVAQVVEGLLAAYPADVDESVRRSRRRAHVVRREPGAEERPGSTGQGGG